MKRQPYKRNPLPPELEIIVSILLDLKDSTQEEVAKFMEKWNSLRRKRAVR